MFGPAFLVNPVTEQLYSDAKMTASKAKTRNVYLPKSVKWYDFWTGKIFEGGQTIAAMAPIETIPLYIKAGSIVPMGRLSNMLQRSLPIHWNYVFIKVQTDSLLSMRMKMITTIMRRVLMLPSPCFGMMQLKRLP